MCRYLTTKSCRSFAIWKETFYEGGSGGCPHKWPTISKTSREGLFSYYVHNLNFPCQYNTSDVLVKTDSTENCDSLQC